MQVFVLILMTMIHTGTLRWTQMEECMWILIQARSGGLVMEILLFTSFQMTTIETRFGLG